MRNNTRALVNQTPVKQMSRNSLQNCGNMHQSTMFIKVFLSETDHLSSAESAII